MTTMPSLVVMLSFRVGRARSHSTNTLETGARIAKLSRDDSVGREVIAKQMLGQDDE